MPRYGAVISIEQLQQHILDVVRTTPDFEDDFDENASENEKYDYWIDDNAHSLAGATPTMEKDLGKVDFSSENASIKPSYGKEFGDIVGFHTLPNGVPYLGVVAGGDWECPLLFVIYWDGKELRGYVPTDGNSWNKVTKAAYGNADESDESELKKILGDKYDPNAKYLYDSSRKTVNPALILADIEKRILVKEQ